MKVVFDTNILVSALVFPGGRGEAALRRVIEEQDRLVATQKNSPMSRCFYLTSLSASSRGESYK